MALQGVLLDIDGTLVLSNDVHAQTWVEAFAKFGYEVPFDQVRPLIGMGGDRIIAKFAPGLNKHEGEGKAISDHHRFVLHQSAAQIVPANGARALVQKMQDSGLKLTIASSTNPGDLDMLLKTAQVDDLVHEATTSGDADASKPAPDIVQAALAKSQLAADEVVMLGDTPYDIEAAGKAGVRVIAVRCGGFSDQQLKGAIAIYNDPADLLEQYDQSPLAQRISSPSSEFI